MNLIVAPVNPYVNVFFNWGNLESTFIIRWLSDYVVAFFRGEGFIGGGIVPAIAIAGAIALILFVWRAVKFGRVLQLLLFLVILLSPFLLSFSLGTAMPNRTQQVFPLAYGAMVLILALQFGIENRGRAWALIMIALVTTWNGQANTRLFLTEYLSFQEGRNNRPSDRGAIT